MNHTNFIENSKKKNLPTKQCNITNNGKKTKTLLFTKKIKKKSQPDQGSDYFHKDFLTRQKIHN